MKIMICGSMNFSKEMLDAKEELEKIGHEVVLPGDIHACLKDPELADLIDGDYERGLRYCIEKNLLKDALDKIKESDAVLVFNKIKNDVEGYIGSSVLMQLGVAFHLGKKIYLLSEMDKNQKCALEVGLTQPIVINDDFSKII